MKPCEIHIYVGGRIICYDRDGNSIPELEGNAGLTAADDTTRIFMHSFSGRMYQVSLAEIRTTNKKKVGFL